MNVILLYSDLRHVSATHVSVCRVVSARIHSIVQLCGFNRGVIRHAIHVCILARISLNTVT